jgi:predicted GTPase
MKNNTTSDFYKEIGELNSKIVLIDGDVQRKKQDVLNIIGRLKYIGEAKRVSDKIDSRGSEELINMFSEQITASLKSWEKTQEQMLEIGKFRNKFNDSFLVIIYGKVKSGKSTLGNYIAESSDTRPEFFRYNHITGLYEKLNGNVFKVDELECTDSIQGFTLPGLTVIDTPGLHSLTEKNEALAKRYIQAADIVIYPVSADAPGRESELLELLELAEMNKPFFLLITKSDRKEEDEVDGELVEVWQNFSDEDRRKQENYMEVAVRKKLASHQSPDTIMHDIISISVKMAKENQVNSKEWNKSNLPLFYDMLASALRDKGIEAKLKAPLELLKTAVKKLISDPETGLNEIIAKVDNENDKIEDKRSKLINIAKQLKSDCIIKVRARTGEFLSLFASGELNGRELLSELKKSMQSICEDTFKAKTIDIVQDIASDLNKQFFTYKLNVLKECDIEIEDITKEVEIDNSRITTGIGSAAGGTGGAIVGGMIGSIFGPVGTFVGGLIGGIIGGAGGGSAGRALASTSIKTIKVGDNREDVEKKIANFAEKEIRAAVNFYIEQLDNEILKGFQIRLMEIRSKVDEVVQDLTRECKE